MIRIVLLSIIVLLCLPARSQDIKPNPKNHYDSLYDSLIKAKKVKPHKYTVKQNRKSKPVVYFIKIYRKDGSIVRGRYMNTKDSSIRVLTKNNNDTLGVSVSFRDISKIKTRKWGKFLVVAKWTGLALASGGLIYGLTQLPSGKSGSSVGSVPPVEQLAVGIVVVVGVFVYPFYKLTTYFPKKKYPWQFEDY